MGDSASPFSAAEQGLGYIFQARFALLKILSLPESCAILLEKEDDVEFVSERGIKSLVSLKHKAEGDRLTNLSTDFWKSVRIWLAHYLTTGRVASTSNFLLFTTATISDGSFLKMFTDGVQAEEFRAKAAQLEIAKSKSALLGAIREELAGLGAEERRDFYARITIFDASPRATDIPALVEPLLRTIRRQARAALFERLEGWWVDLVIKTLAGERKEPVYGYEVSDKLSALAEEYRTDNLPITFRGKQPAGHIDVANDQRLFVRQLHALDLSAARVRSAIIDYYRAFEQRSSWARESLLVSGEIEDYEDRLVEEWGRYREIVLESVAKPSDEEANLRAGRELYRWAEMETSMLRIRERVTEQYVIRAMPSSVLASALSTATRATLRGCCMKRWDHRPIEIRNLFNPAFCGLVLFRAMSGYEEQDQRGMPFSLILLILPLCLHSQSRELLQRGNRSYLLKIIADHPELLVGFARRVTDMLPFTFEALGLLMLGNSFKVESDGRLKAIQTVYERPRLVPQKLSLVSGLHGILARNSPGWAIAPPSIQQWVSGHEDQIDTHL